MSNIFVNPEAVGGGLIGQEFSVLATGTVSAVGDTTITTVVSFTATGTTRAVSLIGSGTDYAKFTVEVNSSTIVTVRSGPSRNVGIFLNLELSATDVIALRVEHFVTGQTSNFEGTILGFT